MPQRNAIAIKIVNTFKVGAIYFVINYCPKGYLDEEK